MTHPQINIYMIEGVYVRMEPKRLSNELTFIIAVLHRNTRKRSYKSDEEINCVHCLSDDKRRIQFFFLPRTHNGVIQLLDSIFSRLMCTCSRYLLTVMLSFKESLPFEVKVLFLMHFRDQACYDLTMTNKVYVACQRDFLSSVDSIKIIFVILDFG